jgi:HK97 family phage prohead protease
VADFITLVRVKAVTDHGERWIEGYASTPDVDRMGDVVEPKGAQYQLPIPLLWQHKHDEPIGSVTEAYVSSKGIRIRARLVAGFAKADEVWQLIRDGVLTAVSIGFRALASEPLPTGGRRFSAWEWLELSVVSVPAQPGAQITVAKCMAHGVGVLEQKAPRERPFRLKTISTCGGIDLSAICGKNFETARDAYIKEQANPERRARLADLGFIRGVEALLNARSALARLADLEQRVAAFEDSGIKYAGTWQRAMDYSRGMVTTHKGSSWIAVVDTTRAEPGDGPDWQLMVKAGRDAR